MIIGNAAGIDVITIARKGLWGKFIPSRFLDCGYCYLVFSKASWSVNRNSFLRLLLVFIVLICSIFSSFSFVIRVFLRGRGISPSHKLLTSEGPVLVVTFQASSHTVAVSRSSGDQTLLFPSPSLAARIWDLTADWLTLTSH
jgi:hypothetical protein